MLIDTDSLQKLKRKDREDECKEWRTFKLSAEQKARFLIKGINSRAYRIAQERITEQLRLTCHEVKNVNQFEESSLARHMEAIAYHLVVDWEGIYSKETGADVTFTPDNMATILKYSGDLGILLHGWILEQSSAIQGAYDEQLQVEVGKPWSFSSTITETLDPKNFNESEKDTESQESPNPESESK